MTTTKHEYTKGVDNSRGAYLDYGVRVVPDDGLNGLDIGYGWRTHWTVLCPHCLTASPYVIGLEDIATPQEVDEGLVHDEWTYGCAKCGLQWESEDTYYDD